MLFLWSTSTCRLNLQQNQIEDKLYWVYTNIRCNIKLKNLDKYRQNKQSWIDFSYSEKQSEERGSYDQNEKLRYSMLIEIQYDFQDSDEEFIRFLLEQEIIARENDDFQGIGDALWLGAYLLARFKRPYDIQLFYKAKFANFDTVCGFDREFMFLSLRDKTEDYVNKHHPDMYDEVKDIYKTFSLDNWWERLSSKFPENERDEPLLELYYRNIYFEKKDIAKIYLEKWKENEPDSKEKDNTLKYAYIDLDEIPKAIKLIKKELDGQKSNWDKASCNHDLLKLHTKLKSSDDGLDVINAIDKEFEQFDTWKKVGLGRMVIHEAFEFALATPNMSIAKTTFKIADKWFKEMNNIALVGLEAGWKAAEKCGFLEKVKLYKKLAHEENERIKNI